MASSEVSFGANWVKKTLKLALLGSKGFGSARYGDVNNFTFQPAIFQQLLQSFHRGMLSIHRYIAQSF